MNILTLSAEKLRDAILQGELSAAEATGVYLDRIDALDDTLNAWVCVDREGAVAKAREVDEKLARKEPVGRLAGVPTAVKDNMCTRGMATTCASRMLENFVPPYDAHVVERLRAADAIILGKTNLDEFAMGSSTEYSARGATRNPWNTERTPGGSSGGSAAAVAADMAALSLGSDTGGSIRQPAAHCGVVGFKPSYGRVSRYGLVAFASSLDQIGPFAQNVRDAALLTEVIAGHDKRDSTSVEACVPPYLEDVEKPLRGLRLGVPREYFGEGIDPQVEKAVREAVAVYERQGAAVMDISLPHTEYAVAAYYVIAPCEASSNLGRYDGVHYGHRAPEAEDTVSLFARSRAQGFGDEVQRRILLGTYALSSGFYDEYYLKAARVRRLIKQDFDKALEDVDAIVCPTSPTAAFRLGEKAGDPLAMYLADVCTLSVNLAGLPGLSLPCGFTDDGLPVGLQIIGRPFEEATVLQAARLFERETDFHARRPAIG